MSFSGDVKRELSQEIGAARHCLIAELSALLTVCADFTLEPARLFIRTENEVSCKKVFTLLQKAFNIKIDMLQGKDDFSLKIEEPSSVFTVLSAVGLIRREGQGEDWHWEKLPSAEERITHRSCCKRAYIRGAFLASGSVNDPNKTYHMEFVFDQPEKAERLRGLLHEFEVEAHLLKRKRFQKYIDVVYIKDGSQISDVLNIMGGHASLLKLENIRVLKDVRNQVNRKVNCEAANLDRVVSAAVRQIDDIRYIEETMGLEGLPEALRETARLRLENEDLSLQELSVLLGIGKSGVNHRLRKLTAIAEEIRKETR